jgi:ribonuclease VapC
MSDGERAANLWTEHPNLSLGDRLCLALADRLVAEAVTADRSWGSSSRIRQIR